MTLTDRTSGAIKKGPPCTICLFVDTLTEDDRAVFDRWLEDPRVTDRMVIDWVLEDEGVTLAKPPLGRHRRRECWDQSRAAD